MPDHNNKESTRGFDVSLKELCQLMELRGATALEKVRGNSLKKIQKFSKFFKIFATKIQKFSR